MKSFKKFLSVILSVLMVFSVFTVCVSAEEEIVEWDEYGETVTYIKGEDAEVGENTFSHIGDFAHRFTAENEGIYAVTMSISEKEACEGYSYSCMVSNSATDTTATDFAEFRYSEEYETVYFFEQGESQYLGVRTEGDIENYTLNVTYLGKVVNVSVKDADRPLQANYEVVLLYDMLVFQRGVIFQTDSGNDVCINDMGIPTELTSFKAGELSAEITALGITQTVTFSVFLAEDEIKAVTPAEGYEAPTAYINKDGEITGYNIESPALLVNVVLKDDTVIKNEYAEEYGEVRVILNDGREIVLSPVFTMEEGKVVYSLGMRGNPLFKVSEAKTELDEEGGEDEEPTLCGILKKILDRIKGVITFLMSLLPPVKLPFFGF